MESFGSPSDCAKGSLEETEFTVPSIHFPLRDQVLVFHTSPGWQPLQLWAFPLSQTHGPVPTCDLDSLSSNNRSGPVETRDSGQRTHVIRHMVLKSTIMRDVWTHRVISWTQKTTFKTFFRFILFYIYGCFSCMYICVPGCLVSEEGTGVPGTGVKSSS